MAQTITIHKCSSNREGSRGKLHRTPPCLPLWGCNACQPARPFKSHLCRALTNRAGCPPRRWRRMQVPPQRPNGWRPLCRRRSWRACCCCPAASCLVAASPAAAAAHAASYRACRYYCRPRPAAPSSSTARPFDSNDCVQSINRFLTAELLLQLAHQALLHLVVGLQQAVGHLQRKCAIKRAVKNGLN